MLTSKHIVIFVAILLFAVIGGNRSHGSAIGDKNLRALEIGNKEHHVAKTRDKRSLEPVPREIQVSQSWCAVVFQYCTTFWKMTIYSNSLHWSEITPIFEPFTEQDLITEFNFLPYYTRFSIEDVQCMWHVNRGRYLLRTPGPVPLWYFMCFMECALLMRRISPELVLFLDFWVSNIHLTFSL